MAPAGRSAAHSLRRNSQASPRRHSRYSAPSSRQIIQAKLAPYARGGRTSQELLRACTLVSDRRGWKWFTALVAPFLLESLDIDVQKPGARPGVCTGVVFGRRNVRRQRRA